MSKSTSKPKFSNKGESSRKSQYSQRRIITSCTNVKVNFYRDEDMLINSWSLSSPQELRIVELESQDRREISTWLDVKGVKYEIVPGVTSCVQLNEKTFLLTDLNCEEGLNAKLTFSQYAKDETCKKFYEIVRDITYSHKQTGGRYERRSMSQNYEIMQVKDRCVGPTPQDISRSVVLGANVAKTIVDSVTPIVIQNITPESKPTEVDPVLENCLTAARYTAEGAAFTSEIMKQVQTMASMANLVLATSNEADQTVNRARDIAADVAGVATMVGGIAEALGIVGNSFVENLTKVVEHKYGQSTEEACDGALHLFGSRTGHYE